MWPSCVGESSSKSAVRLLPGRTQMKRHQNFNSYCLLVKPILIINRLLRAGD